MTSFKKRLRWATLGLIIGLLMIFGVSLYVGLETVLQRHLDHQLLELAQAEASHLQEEAGQLKVFFNRKGELEEGSEEEHHEELFEHDRHELQEAIQKSVVFDAEGQLVWSGESASSTRGVSDRLRLDVLAGNHVFENVTPTGQPSYRLLTFPIVIDERVRFILQTQSSLELMEQTLAWLLIMLMSLAFILLVLGWLGSNWVASQALAPIQTLSRTAKQVSENSLATRMPLVPPFQEFQQLAQSFNTMLERLQKVFEAQRRFVGDAAHELKTPLTAIKGNVEVALQKNRSTEEYQDTLGTILGQIERLIQLTRSLLTLTQFAGERPPVCLNPLHSESLIREVTEEIKVLADVKGCALRLEIKPVPPVLGDAGLLKQVLINLLDNAIRYTKKGGIVTLSLHSTKEEVVMSVEDTGPGIDPAHLPYLFERFYRVDLSRDRQSGGAGLGLAIAKEILEAHHGTIEVWSEVGKGTKFTLSFPAVRNAP